MDDDVDMSDEPSHDDAFQVPLSTHDLDQLQYHLSLQEIGERLQKAANAAFPNENHMRYNAVYVLLLCWEDEDPRLPVSMEVDELRDVFENLYHYNVEMWKIPSDGSHKKLNRKVLDFVEVGNDSKDDLKIVYYGGHGMLARNRQSCWASRPDLKDPSYQTVKWSGIQHALEEAQSDVLLLLDCCASGTANTDFGSGVTEVIAACGFNTMANPVGPDSFTRALITELRLLSNTPSFTVGSLYNKMLCRIQNWMPMGREMQKPPLHIVLTQNRKLPQSIQLSPTRLKNTPPHAQSPPSHQALPSSPYPITDQVESHSLSQSSSSQGFEGSQPPTHGSNPSSASSLFSDKQVCPRIAVTIRLKETLNQSDLSVDLFTDWVRMMPVLADHVKIEAGFASCSTLLVISLPVDMWCYLEGDPSISIMGLVKSSNLVSRPGSFSSASGSLASSAASTQPSEKRPTVSSLGWGSRLGWGSSGWKDIPKKILAMYDFVVPMSGEPYFGLRPEFGEVLECPKKIYLDAHKYPVSDDDSFHFSMKLLQDTLQIPTPKSTSGTTFEAGNGQSRPSFTSAEIIGRSLSALPPTIRSYSSQPMSRSISSRPFASSDKHIVNTTPSTINWTSTSSVPYYDQYVGSSSLDPSFSGVSSRGAQKMALTNSNESTESSATYSSTASSVPPPDIDYSNHSLQYYSEKTNVEDDSKLPYAYCPTCGGTTWVNDMAGAWEACQDCNPTW